MGWKISISTTTLSHKGFHLGNTRLTFADVNGNGSLQANNEILQENTYYPFGLEQSGLMAGVAGIESKYKYNGIVFID